MAMLQLVVIFHDPSPLTASMMHCLMARSRSQALSLRLVRNVCAQILRVTLPTHTHLLRVTFW